MALRGTPHTLTGTFYGSSGGPVEDPTGLALTILLDGEVIVGPVVPPALLRDAPGLYRWVWQIPADAAVGTYVAKWSGVLPGEQQQSVGYERFDVTVADDDPTLIVQPDALAASIGIEAPTAAQRATITDAILGAQADVAAALNRDSLLPVTYTQDGLLGAQSDEDVDVISVRPQEFDGVWTGYYSVTFRTRFDAATDPALEPIRRYVRLHAKNSPEVTTMWRQATGAKGEVKSLSAEGQSVSFAAASLGGGGAPGSGAPGALPTLASLSRWRLISVYQGPTQFGQRYGL